MQNFIKYTFIIVLVLFIFTLIETSIFKNKKNPKLRKDLSTKKGARKRFEKPITKKKDDKNEKPRFKIISKRFKKENRHSQKTSKKTAKAKKKSFLKNNLIAKKNPPKKKSKPKKKPKKKKRRIRIEKDRIYRNGLVTRFFHIQPGYGRILSKHLRPWLTKGKGKIEIEEKLHILMVTDTVENMKIIEKIYNLLNQPERQLMIEARIVEITKTKELQVGGRMEIVTTGRKALLKRFLQTFDIPDFIDAVVGNTTFQGTEIELQKSNRALDLDAVIQAISKYTKLKVLSKPMIKVINGKKAKIHAGEEVPYQTVRISAGVQYITTSFKPVGITLEVTPKFISEDIVELRLRTGVSVVTEFIVTAGDVINPRISKREANTIVNVRNGEFLVIGGLIRNQKTTEKRKVPLLGDIPIIGNLFRSTRKISRDTTLWIILHPHFVKRTEPTPKGGLIIPNNGGK